MKAIVFDIDGVIIDTGSEKERIIENIINSYGVLDKPGVRELLGKRLNRVIIARKISQFFDLDEMQLLGDLNTALKEVEKSPGIVADIINFIKKDKNDFLFFTNTSLPKKITQEIFQKADIIHYFEEILAYEDGTKFENIAYVLKEYGIKSEDLLFIDDHQTHIDAVAPLGVHTLLYTIGEKEIEKEVKKIFYENEIR